jgi:trigger factor
MLKYSVFELFFSIMKTTLTNLEGLQRQLVVAVPKTDFNAKFDKVLNDLKGKVKIDGFRQGRVPVNVIKQKYGANISTDAANEVVSEVLPKAFTEEKLNPAGQPALTKIDLDNAEEFSFTVEFEVFPDVEISDISKLTIEKTVAEITKEDEEKTLEGLKEQAAEFKSSENAAQEGNRVKVDFKGFVDGEAFAGGEAKDFALILGKSQMIPGFEDGIIGKKAGENTTLEVSFPEDYQAKDLAGKPATFEITVNSVEEVIHPEVNDEFAKKFGKESVDELLTGIKEQMQSQLDDKLEQLNKDSAFTAILENNELEVPKASVAQEAQHLLDDMNNRMQQQGLPDNGTKLEASVFNDEATRRVKLGLLVGEITAKNKIEATDDQVQAKLKFMAEQYGEQANQMINYYNTNPQALEGVKSMVVEKLASEFIMDSAKTTEVVKTFSEVVAR